MNPVMLVQSWRKILSGLEDDLQGFPKKEFIMSEILDMVCVIRSFENVNEDNTEEWLQTGACELSFQHITDMDIVNAATKQKGEEDGGEDESEEGGQNSEHISHSMALQCIALLDYMGEKGFKYSDITAARKIHTAMRRSLKVHKNKRPLHTTF
jgi:hypothetical protein